MTELSDEAITTEEARIKSAYARRCSEFLYSYFHPGHLFFVHERERRILALLVALGFHSLDDKQILEIGCGEGYWLREFIKWGGRPENINGIDLLPDRVAKARQLCPQGVRIECGNGGKLPFDDTSFDLVIQSLVFTSVLDFNLKRLMASEMVRVVKKDGVILWYDFYVNNPRNPAVRGVTKREVTELFPHCHIELRRITLAPPLLRLLAPYSWLSCYLLERFKVFNTHYLGVIRRS